MLQCMITDDDYRLFMLSTWKHPHFANGLKSKSAQWSAWSRHVRRYVNIRSVWEASAGSLNTVAFVHVVLSIRVDHASQACTDSA